MLWANERNPSVAAHEFEYKFDIERPIGGTGGQIARASHEAAGQEHVVNAVTSFLLEYKSDKTIYKQIHSI